LPHLGDQLFLLDVESHQEVSLRFYLPLQFVHEDREFGIIIAVCMCFRAAKALFFITHEGILGIALEVDATADGPIAFAAGQFRIFKAAFFGEAAKVISGAESLAGKRGILLTCIIFQL
jgi:hypothetical protein